MDTAKTRKLLRSQRRDLSPKQQLVMADQIAANLCSRSFFLRAKRVGIYLANEGEVNPSIIYDICQKSGKQLFLPVIHPFKQNRLHFAQVKPNSALASNRFGILEPCIKSATLSPPWSLDLVLMPLVVFERARRICGHLVNRFVQTGTTAYVQKYCTARHISTQVAFYHSL